MGTYEPQISRPRISDRSATRKRYLRKQEKKRKLIHFESERLKRLLQKIDQSLGFKDYEDREAA
jgi:hypothetical protein